MRTGIHPDAYWSMTMPKRPDQDPVVLGIDNVGTPFESVVEATVAYPPEDCETQQLIDWAAITAVIPLPIDMGKKLRVVMAYATRHEIEVKRLSLPEFIMMKQQDLRRGSR